MLPFRSLGSDSAGAYLGDGVSEEILTALSRIPGLAVVGRASSFRFRDADIDARQVGRDLDAGALLTGTLQRSGDKVRVSAELVDTRTGRQLWSQTFDRQMRDLFALEDEIARAISEALRVRLAGGVLVRRGTSSVEAHDLVLRATALERQADEPSLERAIILYRQALAIDSTYAAAWAGLSTTYGALADAFRAPLEVAPLAEQAALRAVALDDSLAAGHMALSQVRAYWQYRFAEGHQELRRALELDPGSSMAHLQSAIFLMYLDDDQAGAERELKTAMALDPFNPAIALRWMTLAMNNGNDTLATRLGRRATELSGLPVYYDNALTAAVHATFGRWQQCVQAFDAVPATRITGRFVLATCKAKLGDGKGAREIITQLTSRGYCDQVRIAMIQLALGDRDAALSSIEQALGGSLVEHHQPSSSAPARAAARGAAAPGGARPRRHPDARAAQLGDRRDTNVRRVEPVERVTDSRPS